jgi:hypothetical protein
LSARGGEVQLVSVRALRGQIDAAVIAGKTLEEIDAEILACCALGQDASAALWLYAEGCLDRAAAGHLPQVAPPVSGPVAPA